VFVCVCVCIYIYRQTHRQSIYMCVVLKKIIFNICIFKDYHFNICSFKDYQSTVLILCRKDSKFGFDNSVIQASAN